MTKGTMLIRGGWVIPMTNRAVYDGGAVLVKDGVIGAVFQKGDELPLVDEVVDATGCVVMPGLVNTHCHSPMSLFRGLADDMPLASWLNDHIFPAEAAHINPMTVRAGALLSCVEMLLSGTTTVCDGYFYEDEVAEAVMEVGMRAVLGHGVIDFPAPGVPDPSENVAIAETFVETWKNRWPLITPSIFCHTPHTCSEKTIAKAKEACRRLGVLFQIHIAETEDDVQRMKEDRGISPYQLLDDLQVLDESTLLIHNVWMDDGDMALMATHGVTASHNPGSNTKLASGVCPASALMDQGIHVGLGTDGAASNNNLDLFNEMQTTAKLHKAYSLDPAAMDAWTVLEMATIQGAKAIGLGGQIGSLLPGKRADITIVDMNKPHLTPVYNPASHLVYATTGADVRDVFVDGNQVVKGGNLLTVDVQAVMDEVSRIAKGIEQEIG